MRILGGACIGAINFQRIKIHCHQTCLSPDPLIRHQSMKIDRSVPTKLSHLNSGDFFLFSYSLIIHASSTIFSEIKNMGGTNERRRQYDAPRRSAPFQQFDSSVDGSGGRLSTATQTRLRSLPNSWDRSTSGFHSASTAKNAYSQTAPTF